MEDELSRLVDALPGVIWTAQPDGLADFFNQRWYDYTGLTEAETFRSSWQTTVHPDDLLGAFERWRAIVRAGEPSELEVRLRRADGEYRWFLVRVHPLKDTAGNVVKWCGINSDIDDRKRAETRLRFFQRNFREMCESIPGLVCTMSPAGDVEVLNRELLDYFGRTPEEMRGWGTSDAVHPDDLPRVAAAFAHAVSTASPYDIEHRCRRADGMYRWFQVRALPVRGPDGTVTGWFVHLTDIHDRKQAEDAIRASEKNLDTIINTIPALAWSALPDGAADFFNQHYLEYVGLTQAQATGPGWTMAVHPDDLPGLIGAWRDIMASGALGEAKARLRRSDGTYRWFLFRVNPLRDASGAIVKWYGTNTDIDDLKRAENELRRMEDVRSELAHMTRVASLGALTASIAHEVNQPLSGIITNANTCLRMLAAEPPNVEGAQETARRTIRDGRRAGDVISRLRALFAKKGLASEPVDLNDATREVLTLSSKELQRGKVVVDSCLAEGLPLVAGDRVQLQQVILNLLLNASAAMSDIEDRPRQLSITTEPEDGDRVRLTVRDAGVGFDPDTAEQLFAAFYTTKTGGMGLGLSVSRSIVESHRGRLWAAANDGPGATFSFSIPRASEQSARSP